MPHSDTGVTRIKSSGQGHVAVSGICVGLANYSLALTHSMVLMTAIVTRMHA